MQPQTVDLTNNCVCVRFTGSDGPSGFGFELTFRLKREVGETAPPTWPAELMQGLSRYVFQSGENPEILIFIIICIYTF